MTPFSSRYLVPLLVMLLVAAVPVTAHYVVGMPNEDCENPAALKRLLINGANKAGEWSNRYSYAVSQFTRGEVQGARFLWVRSSVPQPFYGERPFDTPGRYTDGPSQLERVQVDGVEVPIRVWQQQVLGHTEVTAIMMIYDGRPEFEQRRGDDVQRPPPGELRRYHWHGAQLSRGRQSTEAGGLAGRKLDPLPALLWTAVMPRGETERPSPLFARCRLTNAPIGLRRIGSLLGTLSQHEAFRVLGTRGLAV